MCSPKLRLELFTIAAIDKIDHNPSSTSAQGSLHGTSISVFQHFQNESNGVERLAISWVMVSKYHGQHIMPVVFKMLQIILIRHWDAFYLCLRRL